MYSFTNILFYKRMVLNFEAKSIHRKKIRNMAFNLEKFKSVRVERNLSQAELGRITGYSRSYINQIENERILPTRENIIVFAKALKIPPEMLDSSFFLVGKEETTPTITALISGFHIALLQFAYRALKEARIYLFSSSPHRLMHSAKGKTDTYTFDAQCEMIMVEILREFNSKCAILTEEREIRGLEYIDDLCWIMDPVDRSDYLKEILREIQGTYDSIGKYVESSTFQEMEKPDPLNNPTGSITCISRGKIVFSLVLDYMQNTIYMAFGSKVKYGSIEEYPIPEMLLAHGADLNFEKRESRDKFANSEEGICFLGKEIYLELFSELGFTEQEKPLDKSYHTPGGPARILFLTQLAKFKPIFALSCGEKISEFVSWLSFAMASEKLSVFELTPRGYKNFMRYGVIMAPPKAYSALKTEPSAEPENPARISLDMSRLTNLDIPCNFRSAILVTHKDNHLFNANIRIRTNARELYPNRITK